MQTTSKKAMVWLLACALTLLTSAAASAARPDKRPALSAPQTETYDDYYQQDPDASPSDRSAEVHQPAYLHDSSACEPSNQCHDTYNSGCYDCYPSCDCGSAGGCSLLGDCCLGDPWRLDDQIGRGSGWSYGGWFEFGYHSDNVRLSQQRGDLLSFGDNPDNLDMNQAWFYVEKAAQANCCSADWGFRADFVYGVDAQKTQAFGNPGAANVNQGTWDASFDHGIYGWAIPQLYGEVAWGDWSVIAGHFFTPVGYEVVTAPDNFFFTHALTQFNSEPFTHTGVLATYSGYDNVELYGGYTLGWDTGFDQFFGGSNWLGGFSSDLTDDITFTYISTAGNFGFRSAGNDGYSHSLVFDVALTERLSYVLQSDHVHHDGFLGANPALQVSDVGINQYLFYSINDCWSVGSRLEWWKSNTPTLADTQSYYAVTGGINYKPHANVIVRPEVRHDWTPAENNYTNLTGNTSYNQTTFSVDFILTY